MNPQIQEFLYREFLGNSVSRYLVTASVFILGIFLLRDVTPLIMQRIKQLAARTRPAWG